MTNASSTDGRRTTVSRVLEAPPDRVYGAFLDSDALAEWFPPSGVLENLARSVERP